MSHKFFFDLLRTQRELWQPETGGLAAPPRILPRDSLFMCVLFIDDDAKKERDVTFVCRLALLLTQWWTPSICQPLQLMVWHGLRLPNSALSGHSSMRIALMDDVFVEEWKRFAREASESNWCACTPSSHQRRHFVVQMEKRIYTSEVLVDLFTMLPSNRHVVVSNSTAGARRLLADFCVDLRKTAPNREVKPLILDDQTDEQLKDLLPLKLGETVVIFVPFESIYAPKSDLHLLFAQTATSVVFTNLPLHSNVYWDCMELLRPYSRCHRPLGIVLLTRWMKDEKHSCSRDTIDDFLHPIFDEFSEYRSFEELPMNLDDIV